jgi:hypothetical protein
LDFINNYEPIRVLTKIEFRIIEFREVGGKLEIQVKRLRLSSYGFSQGSLACLPGAHQTDSRVSVQGIFHLLLE